MWGDFMNSDDFEIIEIRKVEDEYKRAKLKDASAKIISIICTVVMLMNASANNFKTEVFKNLLFFDEVALLQGVVLVLNKYKKERNLEMSYDLFDIKEEDRIWNKQGFTILVATFGMKDAAKNVKGSYKLIRARQKSKTLKQVCNDTFFLVFRVYFVYNIDELESEWYYE